MVMDTQKCKYFIAVAKNKSFSRAAEEIYVSQPYVSRQILELESELGTKLFIRERKNVTLTPAGEYFLHYCENMLIMEANMQSEMRSFSQKKKGKIRIGISPAIGSYILPVALADYKRTFPDLTIQVDDGDDQLIFKKILDGSLDICFFSLPELPDKFDYQLIRMEPLLLVLPPNHPLGTPEAKGNYANPPYCYSADLKRLQFDPYIGMYKTKGIAMYADRIFQQCEIQPKTIYTFRNIETAYRMAALGHGYTIIPQTVARYSHFMEEPYYYQISLDAQKVFCRTMVAAFRKGRHLGSTESALISCIRKYA